eukprot:2675996-Karenia_brevis.AAC.1
MYLQHCNLSSGLPSGTFGNISGSSSGPMYGGSISRLKEDESGFRRVTFLGHGQQPSFCQPSVKYSSSEARVK